MKAIRRFATTNRKTIAEPLAVQILNHIRAENFGEGTHLSTQQLADRFSVSRSPVTRALDLLAKSGVVEHLPNKGYRVGSTRGSGVSAGDVAESKDPLAALYFRIVADRLRGQLGERVSARALQIRYGVTRSQIGKLLDRMTREGWAERRQGYGWSLASVITTPEALEHSYRLRLAIEPAALLEPTFCLSRPRAEQARERERELLEAIETMPPDMLYERGIRFHEMLAEASGNAFFLEALQRVNRMRRLFTYQMMGNRQRYYRQVGTHIRILDLLMEGRNMEAAETMRSHLLEVLENIRVLPQKSLSAGQENKDEPSS